MNYEKPTSLTYVSSTYICCAVSICKEVIFRLAHTSDLGSIQFNSFTKKLEEYREEMSILLNIKLWS